MNMPNKLERYLGMKKKQIKQFWLNLMNPMALNLSFTILCLLFGFWPCW